tara:strand:- start:545 stop:694 length:150 start_codon:yes stop_codon:yes gene_type:complete
MNNIILEVVMSFIIWHALTVITIIGFAFTLGFIAGSQKNKKVEKISYKF